MKSLGRFQGRKGFFIIWLGQVVSLIGTGLTAFALSVWVYQETGEVTKLGGILLSLALPAVLLSPVAGVVVDRFDRRKILILSDLGAAISTGAVAILFATGHLEVWHLYVTSVWSSICTTFQLPAYSASIPLLVPKRHLGRANGMVQMGAAAGQIVAPLAGGLLLVTIGVPGVLVIDLSTFVFAVSALLVVRIPMPEKTEEGTTDRGRFWREALAGWHFVRERPGFLGLLLFFAVTNSMAAMVNLLGVPLILSFASPAVLGTVSSIAGVGLLLGGLTLSVWGGSKRRIQDVLGFTVLSGCFILLVGLREWAVQFAVGGFGFLFCMPIVSGSSEAIWQSKVAQDLQGRVYAIRKVIASSARPLAYVVGGPLADRVFEPLLAPGGALTGSVGRVLGVGEGRGIGLLFVILGLLTVLAAVAGYMHPRIRNLESEVPSRGVRDEPDEGPEIPEAAEAGTASGG